MDNQLQVALQSIRTELLKSDYLCDEQLASSVHLALELKRPLLLEGDAGVGKTALAQALAGMVGRPLIRLQCFEGLDHQDAVYEWNYGRQLTEIRLAEAASQRVDSSSIYSDEFLIQKPILKALQELSGAVLLIDEIDRSDEAFEAYMQVVYSFLSEGLVRSSKNLVWFTRAGFAAAALQADLENPRGAIAVYDRMVEAAVPASKEAQQRADAIRGRLQSVGQEVEECDVWFTAKGWMDDGADLGLWGGGSRLVFGSVVSFTSLIWLFSIIEI